MLRRWTVYLSRIAAAYLLLVSAWVLYFAVSMPTLLAGVWGIYNATTIGAPIALAVVAFVRRRRRSFVVLPLAGAVVLLGIRIYATHIEPENLKIREVTIVTDKLTKPIRIAHISDIQTLGVGAYEMKALATLRALEPDLVIHTGDLLQNQDLSQTAAELAKFAPLFEEIHAPLGRFHVTGDTDWRIKDLYSEFSGFQVLDDVSIVLTNGTDRIRLYGITTRNARRPREIAPRIAAWRAMDPDAFNIVYAHPPDFVLGLKDEPVDLCLAGHTHGGQIRVPLFGPPVIASQVPRDLARGFHQYGQTRLNTSAGIGAEHAYGLPSIRFNCPPELTIIRVVPRGAER